METKIESLLATFTLILLITVLGMITSNVMGQELFLQPIGTSLEQASHRLDDFPQFQKSFVPDGLEIGCVGFVASYHFSNDSLQSMQVERSFHNDKAALKSMEVSLLYIERSGATMVLLHRDAKHIRYCAIAEKTAYEVDLSMKGSNLPTLTIREWARAKNAPATTIDANSATALYIPTK